MDTREGATGMGSEQLGDLRTEEWRDRLTGGGGNSVIIAKALWNTGGEGVRSRAGLARHHRDSGQQAIQWDMGFVDVLSFLGCERTRNL